MNGVNKTLYIPLYGKAYVSAKHLFLHDRKAEEIWATERFPLKGKSKSKWLAYYMGIRAAVFDDWAKQQMATAPHAVVIHIGCGMDSRVVRVGTQNHPWYDVDFPNVIAERKRYYSESADYHMLAADVRDRHWLDSIPKSSYAIVIMEGVSMYLTPQSLRQLTVNISHHFERLVLLVDCYTTMAANMTKYKNPIHDVGVSEVYGMDDPMVLQNDRWTFVKEHTITPQPYIDELKGLEKYIFEKVYAGRLAKRLYRLFEYQTG